MKHAFPNDRAGNINIALNNFGQEYELIIEDDGIGMPENINFKEYNSLGLQIINNLVNQIEGTIELNNDVGTQFRILFNELNYKKRF
jgi:two-component sensor histidine kinase